MPFDPTIQELYGPDYVKYLSKKRPRTAKDANWWNNPLSKLYRTWLNRRYVRLAALRGKLSQQAIDNEIFLRAIEEVQVELEVELDYLPEASISMFRADIEALSTIHEHIENDQTDIEEALFSLDDMIATVKDRLA